jgi:hypothetical protein
MPVIVRMSVLALMLVPMNIFACMLMSMIVVVVVVVPTVIVSLHRPHLT